MDPQDRSDDEVDAGIVLDFETDTSLDDDDDDDDDEGDLPSLKFDAMDTNDGAPPEAEGCKKADFLFVIDDSGSMEDEQDNLVGSFPAFIEEIQLELSDTEGYHIGVISTDLYEFNDGCLQEGAMITATGGDGSSDETCGPFVEGHSYMTELDELDLAFACTAQIGVDGSGDERGMQTMQAALAPDMIAPGGCNEGFLRDDALLVIVLITDEEDDHELDGCDQQAKDGSKGEPADWFEGVVAAKGGVESNIVVLALVGPEGPDPAMCPELDKCAGGKLGAEVGTRIIEFTSMFSNGLVGRVCEPSYADVFADAVALIDGACDEFEPVL